MITGFPMDGKLSSFILLVSVICLGCQGLFEDLDGLEAPEEQGEFTVQTISVVEITASGATFNGELSGIAPGHQYDRGFCWATDDNPELEVADCHSMGPTDSGGWFSHREDSLEPGRNYFVRAFASSNGQDFYGEQLDFVTEAPAPEISATYVDGRVNITWEPMGGVDDFTLYRDGEPLQTLDGDADGFVDDELPTNPIPRVQNLQVTDSDAYSIDLVWDPIDTDEPILIEYVLEAHYPAASVASDPESIEIDAEFDISDYEIEFDEDDQWQSTGGDVEFSDEHAPPPSIDGTLVASQGTSLISVRLEVEDLEFLEGAERTYRVRAVGADNTRGAPSEPVAGSRHVDPDVDDTLLYDWEYLDDEADWQPLDENPTWQSFFFDADPPADGSERSYRVTITLDIIEDAEPVILGPATGWIALTSLFTASTPAPHPSVRVDIDGESDRPVGSSDEAFTNVATTPSGYRFVGGYRYDDEFDPDSAPTEPMEWFVSAYTFGGDLLGESSHPIVEDTVAHGPVLIAPVSSARVFAAVTLVVNGEFDSRVYRSGTDGSLVEVASFPHTRITGLATTNNHIYVLKNTDEDWEDLECGVEGACLAVIKDNYSDPPEQVLQVPLGSISVGGVTTQLVEAHLISVGSDPETVYVVGDDDLYRYDDIFNEPGFGSGLPPSWSLSESLGDDDALGSSISALSSDDEDLYFGVESGHVFVAPHPNPDEPSTMTLDSFEPPSPQAGTTVTAVVSDPDGNFYVAWLDGTVRKFDVDGNPQWILTDLLTSDFALFDIAVTPGLYGAFPGAW